MSNLPTYSPPPFTKDLQQRLFVFFGNYPIALQARYNEDGKVFNFYFLKYSGAPGKTVRMKGCQQMIKALRPFIETYLIEDVVTDLHLRYRLYGDITLTILQRGKVEVWFQYIMAIKHTRSWKFPERAPKKEFV